MLGIHFCGCGWVPVRYLCFGAKLAQRACARDLLRDRKKTRKGKVPEQNRRKQSTEEESSQQERAVNRSQQNRALKRIELELGSVDSEAGLVNVRGWVIVPGGFVGILLEYTLAIAHRCTESYTKVSQTSPFLRLALTQVRVYLFSFLTQVRVYLFSFLPHVMFCVFVKKCEIPLAGDEINH